MNQPIGWRPRPITADTEYNILRAFGSVTRIPWTKESSAEILLILGLRESKYRARTFDILSRFTEGLIQRDFLCLDSGSSSTYVLTEKGRKALELMEELDKLCRS